MIFARAKKVEKLINDQEHAMIWMNLSEGSHHFLEGCLVVHHLIGRRE